jgi:hypothetical protein
MWPVVPVVDSGLENPVFMEESDLPVGFTSMAAYQTAFDLQQAARAEAARLAYEASRLSPGAERIRQQTAYENARFLAEQSFLSPVEQSFPELLPSPVPLSRAPSLALPSVSYEGTLPIIERQIAPNVTEYTNVYQVGAASEESPVLGPIGIAPAEITYDAEAYQP